MYWYDIHREGMTYGPRDIEKIEHNFGSLESQRENPLSIYNYYKRAVRLRNENPEIARGEITYMTNISDVDICAIAKSYQGSMIYMLYNISEEEIEITVPKATYQYDGIRGYLSATGEEVLIDKETLTLPPYSIVVLK
jgi:glycosidase